jgi:hypothetical protein
MGRIIPYMKWKIELMFLTFPNQLFKFNHHLLDCDLVEDTPIESPDIPWDSWGG